MLKRERERGRGREKRGRRRRRRREEGKRNRGTGGFQPSSSFIHFPFFFKFTHSLIFNPIYFPSSSSLLSLFFLSLFLFLFYPSSPFPHPHLHPLCLTTLHTHTCFAPPIDNSLLPLLFFFSSSFLPFHLTQEASRHFFSFH